MAFGKLEVFVFNGNTDYNVGNANAGIYPNKGLINTLHLISAGTGVDLRLVSYI